MGARRRPWLEGRLGRNTAPPTLRFFRLGAPRPSRLGYGQPLDHPHRRRGPPRRSGIGLVRRPTGGQARSLHEGPDLGADLQRGPRAQGDFEGRGRSARGTLPVDRRRPSAGGPCAASAAPGRDGGRCSPSDPPPRCADLLLRADRVPMSSRWAGLKVVGSAPAGGHGGPGFLPAARLGDAGGRTRPAACAASFSFPEPGGPAEREPARRQDHASRRLLVPASPGFDETMNPRWGEGLPRGSHGSRARARRALPFPRWSGRRRSSR